MKILGLFLVVFYAILMLFALWKQTSRDAAGSTSATEDTPPGDGPLPASSTPPASLEKKRFPMKYLPHLYRNRMSAASGICAALRNPKPQHAARHYHRNGRDFCRHAAQRHPPEKSPSPASCHPAAPGDCTRHHLPTGIIGRPKLWRFCAKCARKHLTMAPGEQEKSYRNHRKRAKYVDIYMLSLYNPFKRNQKTSEPHSEGGSLEIYRTERNYD